MVWYQVIGYMEPTKSFHCRFKHLFCFVLFPSPSGHFRIPEIHTSVFTLFVYLDGFEFRVVNIIRSLALLQASFFQRTQIWIAKKIFSTLSNYYFEKNRGNILMITGMKFSLDFVFEFFPNSFWIILNDSNNFFMPNLCLLLEYVPSLFDEFWLACRGFYKIRLKYEWQHVIRNFSGFKMQLKLFYI